MATLYFVNRFFWPDTSATSQLLTDLATSLAAAGHDVTVAACRHRYQHADEVLPSREEYAGVRVRRLRSSNFGRHSRPGRMLDYLSFYASAILDVALHCGRGDIVVVKTDPPLLGLPLAALGLIRRFRLVNWIQDLFPEVAESAGIGAVQGRLGSFLKRLRDWSLCQSAANVVIGRRMEEALTRRGIPTDRLMQITNWSLAPEQAPSHTGLREHWGLAGRFVVMYSGNMGEAHDHQTILGAMRRLAADEGIVFLFVGGGKRLQQLLQIAETEGLRHIVTRPLQPLEYMAESLRVGDVHLISLLPAFDTQIVPSKYYGILSAGRPALFIGSADNDVAREITLEKLGTVVSPGDDAALAAAILDARALVTDREAQGQRARAIYEQRYTRTSALDRWHRLVLQLAQPASNRKTGA